MTFRGGRIAYDVTGSGPLVVLSHGIGDRRQDYRFLAPMLAQAGYRVATADLRGHGESSMGWPSITRTDIAGDLAALRRTEPGARAELTTGRELFMSARMRLGAARAWASPPRTRETVGANLVCPSSSPPSV